MARPDAPGPFNLDALRALPAPQIFTTDSTTIKDQLVAWFQGETQRTLYPMQTEMLLIDMVSYLWSLFNTSAQYAHLQRYAALADLPWLQQLGAMPGIETPILLAAPAVTTFQFALAEALAVNVIVPAGTRVSAGDDATVFTADADLVITAGATDGTVSATAATPGAGGNGFAPGAIATLLDPIAGVATVANVTASFGGADAETPDAYRIRLCNALEKASISGQRMGYIEHVMAFSSTIIDCGATRPQPCYVNLYPLTADGPASADLRADIQAYINGLQDDEYLPMGDLVTVLAPAAVALDATLALVVSSSDPAVVTAATDAAAAVTAKWARQLGAEIAPEAVRAAVKAVPGVVNVETPNLAYQRLNETQYAAIAAGAPNVAVSA